MAQSEIEKKIASLERGIKSSATPEKMKSAMRTQLAKLKEQIGDKKKPEAKGDKPDMNSNEGRRIILQMMQDDGELSDKEFEDKLKNELNVNYVEVAGITSARPIFDGETDKAKRHEILDTLWVTTSRINGIFKNDKREIKLAASAIENDYKDNLVKASNEASYRPYVIHLQKAMGELLKPHTDGIVKRPVRKKIENYFEVAMAGTGTIDKKKAAILDKAVNKKDASEKRDGYFHFMEKSAQELGKIYEEVVGYNLYDDLKETESFKGKSDQDIKHEILRMMVGYDKAKGSENAFLNYGKKTGGSGKKSSAREKQVGLKNQTISELESNYKSHTGKHDRARIVNEFHRRLNLKSLSADDRKEINAFFQANGLKGKGKKHAMLMDGRPLNEIPCDELVAMLEERRAKHSKSERKSKTKPVMKKITTDITQAVSKAIDDIPAKKLKAHKRKVIASLKNLKKKAGEFAQAFKTVLGSDYEASPIKTMMSDIDKQISDLENKNA